MEPFKNLLSAQTVEHLADHVFRVCPNARRGQFVPELVTRIATLEMKDRARAMADALREVLPTDPGPRAEALKAMLHPATDGAGTCDDDGLRGWAVWPLTMLVATDGLEDFDRSMALLRDMTMRFTSEFAVRAFLLADTRRALAIMSRWVDDPNPHVRRLVSEGTRPRLPWGERLPMFVKDPLPILPLLEALRDDPSEYVRRSVANSLNDIAKDHPAVVTRIAGRWMDDASEARAKLVRHALRSLIKAGNPEALQVMGMKAPVLEAGVPVLAADRIALGQTLEVTCTLASRSDGPQKLGVDVVIWFLKADGTRRPKVFKGSVITLAAAQSLIFRKSIPLRAVTTRRHYTGAHQVALRINGRDTGLTDFWLEA